MTVAPVETGGGLVICSHSPVASELRGGANLAPLPEAEGLDLCYL